MIYIHLKIDAKASKRIKKFIKTFLSQRKIREKKLDLIYKRKKHAKLDKYKNQTKIHKGNVDKKNNLQLARKIDIQKILPEVLILYSQSKSFIRALKDAEIKKVNQRMLNKCFAWFFSEFFVKGFIRKMESILSGKEKNPQLIRINSFGDSRIDKIFFPAFADNIINQCYMEEVRLRVEINIFHYFGSEKFEQLVTILREKFDTDIATTTKNFRFLIIKA